MSKYRFSRITGQLLAPDEFRERYYRRRSYRLRTMWIALGEEMGIYRLLGWLEHHLTQLAETHPLLLGWLTR